MIVKDFFLSDEASREIKHEIDYYNEHRPGTGERFRDEVERALNLISKQPQAFPRHRKVFRKCVLRKFPFNIYFLELPDRIWIAAVAHAKKRPDYWIHRKPETQNERD